MVEYSDISNQRMRIFGLLLCVVSAAMGQYTDVLTRGNVAPVDVIDFAIESATSDVLSQRAIAEARRSEAAGLATLSRQRSQAETALQSLIAADKLHRASVDDVLA